MSITHRLLIGICFREENEPETRRKMAVIDIAKHKNDLVSNSVDKMESGGRIYEYFCNWWHGTNAVYS